MTTQQFRRMQVFAIRMVPTAIGGGRWRKALRDHVSEILYRMRVPNFWLEYKEIISWDHNHLIPKEERVANDFNIYGAHLLCDYLSQYCYENGLEKEIEDRHGNCRQVDTKLGTALQCCLRAACDVAADPSAGVLGWTVGDLRKMWAPKPVPKWVRAYFKEPDKFDSFKDNDAIWL